MTPTIPVSPHAWVEQLGGTDLLHARQRPWTGVSVAHWRFAR